MYIVWEGDRVEAYCVRDYLRSAGIDAFVRDSFSGGILPLPIITSVVVSSAYEASRAKKLLSKVEIKNRLKLLSSNSDFPVNHLDS